MKNSTTPISSKAAQRGEPSYIWRAGQERRFEMIRAAAGPGLHGRVLDAGCGVGEYLSRLEQEADQAVGLEVELERCQDAFQKCGQVLYGNGEKMPFAENTFDMALSHEVLEHVHDDRQVVEEIVRVLKPHGRLIVFVPNRGYLFETHGIYWRGRYRFGNKFLVNYLPRKWRNTLAPHVRAYSRRDLDALFSKLPVKVVQRTVIFGAYDNIIARMPWLGKTLRSILQWLESTPLKFFGLSHFWVLEKRLTLREYLKEG